MDVLCILGITHREHHWGLFPQGATVAPAGPERWCSPPRAPYRNDDQHKDITPSHARVVLQMDSLEIFTDSMAKLGNSNSQPLPLFGASGDLVDVLDASSTSGPKATKMEVLTMPAASFPVGQS